MESQGKGHPLPKFGEWDVNNPASAEGFTVIFTKARNEKKTSNSNLPTPTRNDVNDIKPESPYQNPRKSKKLFCCC